MKQAIIVTLVLVAAVTVVFSQSSSDECSPSKPRGIRVRPTECCKVGEVIPKESFKSAINQCKDKYPRSHPSGPPPTFQPGERPTPSPEMKSHHACMTKCIYKSAGLLTADDKLNQSALKTYFTSNNTALASVQSTAIDKCIASSQSNLDTTLECSSEPVVFQRCLFRQVFLNCPSTVWTTSAECEELKAKVIRCPDMPLMLMHHGRGHHRD